MPEPDKLQKLYNNMLKSERVTETELGDFESFKLDISDSAKAHKFYNRSIAEKTFNEKELGNWESFSGNLNEYFQAKPEQTEQPEDDDLDNQLNKIDELIGKESKDWKERVGKTDAGKEIKDYLKELKESPLKTLYGFNKDVKFSTDVSDKKKYLIDAKDLVLKAKKLKENTGDESAIKQFGQGLLSPLAKDFFSMGLNEMARSFNVLEVAEKSQKGELLSEEEETLLQSYGIYQQLSRGDKDIAYSVGRGLTEMIPYMTQFVLTGGANTAVKGGVNLMLKTAKKKAFKKLVSKSIAYTAGAAAQSPLMTMGYTGFAGRKTGEFTAEGEYEKGTAEPFLEAAYKAGATQFAEVFTEGLGGVATKELKFFGKKFTGIAPTVVKRFEKAAKWDGFLLEYGEEFVNSYLQAALTGDRKISEVWDTKEQLVTALTVAGMGGAFYTSNKVNRVIDKKINLLGIDNEIKEKVNTALKLEDSKEIGENLYNIFSEGNLSSKQLAKIVNYSLSEVSRKSGEEAFIKVQEKLQAQDETQIQEPLSEEATEEQQIKSESAEQIHNFVKNITHKDGRVIEVIDQQDNVFYVKDGEVTEEGDSWVTSKDKPLMVSDRDGNNVQMFDPKKIKTLNIETPEGLEDKMMFQTY